jgi:nucleoside-diphosphate-sugar epimerase
VVTGGAGRVGSYVTRELAAAGHQVIVLDRVGPASLEPGVRWVRGDTQDYGEVVSTLAGADAAVHLAAIPLPGTAPDPVLFRTNVLGTYHVHEAAASLGIHRVVSAGSTAVLGWAYRSRDFLPSYLPVDEDHPLAPQDAYGMGKLCEEQIARAYSLRCDMESVVLRLGRILTPEASAALRQQGGTPPTRFDAFAYVDVRDAATAFRLAVERPGLPHQALHIVADDSSCAEPLCTLLPRLKPELGDMAQALQGDRSGISNQRARTILGWQPRYSWRADARQAAPTSGQRSAVS